MLQFSDPCVATTQAVPPGQCQAPKLQGKPKATSLHLRWSMYKYLPSNIIYIYIQINTWAFPYWPGYHPETPIWVEG